MNLSEAKRGCYCNFCIDMRVRKYYKDKNMRDETQ